MRAEDRIAAAAGIIGVVLGAIGALVDRMWSFPPTTATAAGLTDFFTSNRSSLLVAMILNSVAVTLWLVFGAGVWARMRGVADGFFAACFALGLTMFVALLLGGFLFFFVAVYRAPSIDEPRLLYDAAFGLLAMSGLPTAVSLSAFAVHVFQTGQTPRWTAYLALIGAGAHLALLASLVVREGFFSLEGPVIILIPATLFAWIVGTGYAMVTAGAGGASDLGLRHTLVPSD